MLKSHNLHAFMDKHISDIKTLLFSEIRINL